MKWLELVCCWWKCKLVQALGLAVSTKAKYIPNLARNTTLGNNPNRTQHICPPKVIHWNIQNSFTHNNPKLDTNLTSSNIKMNDRIVIYLYNGILCNEKNLWTTATYNSLNEETRVYTVWFHVYEIKTQAKAIYSDIDRDNSYVCVTFIERRNSGTNKTQFTV